MICVTVGEICLTAGSWGIGISGGEHTKPKAGDRANNGVNGITSPSNYLRQEAPPF